MGLGDVVLMGVVNVTPNSFSDGGEFYDAGAAVGHGMALVKDGAGVLDVGAEASSFFRPGVGAVEAAEQVRRLMPVVKGLAGRVTEGVRISIDTRSAVVAREMLGVGADWINDISAGTFDGELLQEVGGARTLRGEKAGIVLMHMSAGYPATATADDRDIVGTVRSWLRDRVRTAVAAGIDAERIWVDPGIGFGKTMADNWRLAMRAAELVGDGVPGRVVIGLSRKRFLETPPPPDVEALAKVSSYVPVHKNLTRLAEGMAHARDAMTAWVTGIAARRLDAAGVEQIHRVHHVTLVREGLRLVPG